MSQTRAYCQHCLRPQIACICHCVLPVKHTIAVNILQHVKEQTQAKGTAKLADLCLQHSQLHIIDPKLPKKMSVKKLAVLFPHAQALTLNVQSTVHIQQCGGLTLLDGTWRQANQLVKVIEQSDITEVTYYRLPANINETAYATLRRTKKYAAFSTVEAIAAALAILEPDNHDMLNLNKAFEQFLAFQMAFRSS